MARQGRGRVKGPSDTLGRGRGHPVYAELGERQFLKFPTVTFRKTFIDG